MIHTSVLKFKPTNYIFSLRLSNSQLISKKIAIKIYLSLNKHQNMSTVLSKIEQFENAMMNEVDLIINAGVKMTRPGSVNYLMHGSRPSVQSVNIKMGKFGEKIPQYIIENSPNLELLKCGVQCIDKKNKIKKDLDLLWKDDIQKIIYYREAKGNIELDSEKLPATIDKVEEILNTYIKQTYPDYKIDIGVFNWSIYNRDNLQIGLSHIKKCEDRGIKVEHMGDMMNLLNFEWTEDNYNSFFRNVGKRIDEMFMV